MSIKDNYIVKQIAKKEAKTIISLYHYLGDKGFRVKLSYGLFSKEDNELIGAAIYHNVSAPETIVGAFGLDRKAQEGIFELGRLVLKPEYNGGNFTSYLVANSIKLLKKDTNVRALISYATSDRHVGYVYQATNFKYFGLTAPKKDFWVNGKIQERGSTKDKEGVWVPRPRKHRYALVYDRKLDIKWEQLSYPKGYTTSEECYGCNGTGNVFSRGKDYSCPICQSSFQVPEDVLIIGGYNRAIIDIVSVGNHKVPVYDTNKIIEILVDQGLTEEEATEYFDYNIYSAKAGDRNPIFTNVFQ